MMPDRRHPSDPSTRAMLVLRVRRAIDDQDDVQREALLSMFLSAAWIASRVFEQ
jgi:hypothetical protein